MEQNLDNKIPTKEKIIFFFNKNKFKIIFLIIIILITTITLIIVKTSEKKENILISEKFIKASMFLSNGKREEAKNYYEEIILSKNKFYSLLALNAILEKNLVLEKEKISSYFDVLEKIDFSEENNDLIAFKKALYFINIGNLDSGKKILENLINKESSLKAIAQKIIDE